MVSARRRPAYLSREPARHDRWLASYADVITVLLVLFIAAAAQATARRAEAVVAAKKTASAPAPPPASAKNTGLSPELLALQGKLREQDADLRIENRGVVISLPQAILFPAGHARIAGPALALVGEIANVIRPIPNRISLVGHSDDTPIRNKRFHSNWELAAARGVKLLEVLASEFEIPEERLSIASFGSHQPRTSNDTPEGRAANRRVEIVILPE